MKITSLEYKNWIGELKQRIRQSQIKAAVKVNTELLRLYWELGNDIVERQKNSQWGDGFLKQLSQDLFAEFPEMGGFSVRNLQLICKWYNFYNQKLTITKQVVSQLQEDQLFYNVRLHCYVVVELKTVKFKPEHIGQLNFYVSAVDNQMRTDKDNPTIGLLICKDKNDVVAEYTLRNVDSPIGVSSVKIYDQLTADYKSSLPTIEEIEAQLKDMED